MNANTITIVVNSLITTLLVVYAAFEGGGLEVWMMVGFSFIGLFWVFVSAPVVSGNTKLAFTLCQLFMFPAVFLASMKVVDYDGKVYFLQNAAPLLFAAGAVLKNRYGSLIAEEDTRVEHVSLWDKVLLGMTIFSFVFCLCPMVYAIMVEDAELILEVAYLARFSMLLLFAVIFVVWVAACVKKKRVAVDDAV